MPEKDPELKDWKITPEAYEWGEAARESLSQAELFDRMRSAFVPPIAANRAGTPALARHELLVEEFIRLLEDESPKFRAFRDTVIGILSDRLESEPEESASDKVKFR